MGSHLTEMPRISLRYKGIHCRTEQRAVDERCDKGAGATRWSPAAAPWSCALRPTRSTTSAGSGSVHNSDSVKLGCRELYEYTHRVMETR